MSSRSLLGNVCAVRSPIPSCVNRPRRRTTPDSSTLSASARSSQSFPSCHTSHCVEVRQFFLKLNLVLAFGPHRKANPSWFLLPHRHLLQLPLAPLAVHHSRPAFSHPKPATMLAILQLHSYFTAVIVMTMTAHDSSDKFRTISFAYCNYFPNPHPLTRSSRLIARG